MNQNLAELIRRVDVVQAVGSVETKVHGIRYDSRLVQAGDLFVAVPGLKNDGHHFVDEAARRGAIAAVVERLPSEPVPLTVIQVPNSRLALGQLAAAFYGDPASRLNMVGVTGTNGKTTTTCLVEAILWEANLPAGLIGTVENRLGSQKFAGERTTPESLDLQELLAGMADSGAKYVVMEVSSHALELRRVAECEFDVGIFTNLTQDHLDFHETMEAYFRSKARLFIEMGNGRKARQKRAVINIDDRFGAEMSRLATVPVTTFGLGQHADVKARDVRNTPLGTSFLVVAGEVSFPLNLKLAGVFNVYNSLAACAAALGEGIAPEVIRKALGKVPGVAGRFELVDCGQPFAVVVDYAHTPDGLENVLKAARDITEGRLITVFGCGGDRDRAKRPLMGGIAARLSQICIITSDNPRSEDPEAIIAEIEKGVREITTRYQVIPDRRQAIGTAVSLAAPGDTVVVAGKGHEAYQIIGNQVLPFDDRQVAREAIQALGRWGNEP